MKNTVENPCLVFFLLLLYSARRMCFAGLKDGCVFGCFSTLQFDLIYFAQLYNCEIIKTDNCFFFPTTTQTDGRTDGQTNK